MQKIDNHVLQSNLIKNFITFIKGEGVYVYDEDGKCYLDAIGGVGVVNIGHGIPEVIDAINQQLRSLSFSYGGVGDNKPRQELAEKLQQWMPSEMGDTKTLFCSGGAEANEAALKIAYQYHWERGIPTKSKIIGRWQSYHGNTIGALSMSGRTGWRRMHNQYLLNFPHILAPSCYRCPLEKTYPNCGIACAYELRRTVRQEGAENIAAFIAEPVIGTSMSAVVPPPEYYRIIRDICDEYDILFIVDEVMSGVGRTGKNWGIEHWAVTPDIITSAKGIAGGYSPLAAVVFSEKVWRAIFSGSKSPMHSYTYGGNPLSCATGVAVLNYIEKNNLVKRAGIVGERLLQFLRDEIGNQPYVGEIRGKGLFIGIELVKNRETKAPFPAEWDVTHRIVDAALEKGLLILGGVIGTIDGIVGDHIELLPPYTIEDEHIDFIVATLKEVISQETSRLPDLNLRV
jgi:adenosylmethionine-8-amino-7-oxononanoate aminotransferase